MQAPTLSCCKKSSKSEVISLEVVRGGSRWWRNLLERAIHGTYTRLNEPPRLVNIGTTGGHSSHSLSSLVVFHSYRWSLAPPGYYQPSSHYSLHWSRNTWLRQHMDQHWASSRLNAARFLFSVIWSLHITLKIDRQSYKSKHLKLSAVTGVLCLSIFASNSFPDNLHERLQEGTNKYPFYWTNSDHCLLHVFVIIDS